MENLTLIFSAIAASASVLSVILMLKSNHDNKKHLRHRPEALDEEYNGFFGHMVDNTGRDKVRVEINTLKKDLNIKQ
jgi:hypothetical protein